MMVIVKRNWKSKINQVLHYTFNNAFKYDGISKSVVQFDFKIRTDHILRENINSIKTNFKIRTHHII